MKNTVSDSLLNLNKIFEKSIFKIPFYQRGYAWNEKQLNDFWSDLTNVNTHMHYTGMLSFKPIGKDDLCLSFDQWFIKSNDIQPYYVVDGQQRLTTCILLIREICCLAKTNNIKQINGEPLLDIWKKYIKVDKSDDLEHTYILGYEKNDDHQKYWENILDNSSVGELKQNFYTQNLLKAKQYFGNQLQKVMITGSFDDIEKIYKNLTNNFLFNIFNVKNDFDVNVAFETMNYRGKGLTVLEILKNRLVYLTQVLYEKGKADETSCDKLRNVINNAWTTVYYELGRNTNHQLSDDKYLEAHWIIYFDYTRSKESPYKEFLLEKKFVPQNIYDNNLEPLEIKRYSESLQKLSSAWYYTHFPKESSNLTTDEKTYIEKINRIGESSFKPIVMIAIADQQFSHEKRLLLFKKIERFIFIYQSLGRNSANFKNTSFYTLARKIYFKNKKEDNKVYTFDDLNNLLDSYLNNVEEIKKCILNFKNYMLKNFSKKKGYFHWKTIRYFLYEYEMHLLSNDRTPNMQNIDPDKYFYSKDVDRDSIEHIYPQTPKSYNWRNDFRMFNEEKNELSILKHSLGNLLPLSLSLNSSEHNVDYSVKKNLYAINSKSARVVASNNEKWTAKEIKDRTDVLLSFMIQNWSLPIDSATKDELSGLSFVNDNRPVPPNLPRPVEQENAQNQKNTRRSRIPVDEFLKTSDENLVSYFNTIRDQIKAICPEMYEYAIPDRYIAFNVKKRSFVCIFFHPRKQQIEFQIDVPRKTYSIQGVAKPLHYGWPLRYVFKISADGSQTKDAILMIQESYKSIKNKQERN